MNIKNLDSFLDKPARKINDIEVLKYAYNKLTWLILLMTGLLIFNSIRYLAWLGIILMIPSIVFTIREYTKFILTIKNAGGLLAFLKKKNSKTD